MRYVYAFELSARDQTVLWLFLAVLIGELATWVGPRRARPWHQALVAMVVTGTLVLIPVIAVGPG